MLFLDDEEKRWIALDKVLAFSHVLSYLISLWVAERPLLLAVALIITGVCFSSLRKLAAEVFSPPPTSVALNSTTFDLLPREKQIQVSTTIYAMLGLLPIRNYAIGNSRMIFISYTIFTLTNCAVHDKKPIRFWGMYLALMLSFLFCPAFSWIDAWVLTIIHLTSVISSDLNFQRNSKFQELYHNQTVHLSAIYHEIKTPMNGIVCANELIKEELGRIAKQYNHSCDLDKAYEWLEVVRTCSISLSEMIENMLSFSKIQSSTFNLSLTSVYLTEILYSVKQIMNAYPRHPTVQLEWNDKEAEGLWVLGHHIALRQVIINIMTNALKFTERGHVRLTIKNLSDKVEFQISDTGIGMTKSFIQRGLFEPFKQEEAGITGNQRGIGLGMPLSKEMIERMEGSINATSEKGNGTTIRFQLGTVACSSPAPQMSPLTRGDSSCLTDPEVPRVPIHALVVDDNAINRKVIFNLKIQFKFKLKSS
eukprot:TRINITY_DN630_c0_g1_i4.p1 TRINITY_DN630_c0_g1~~TRINITY_DN630_c0_g1_i4.p1  ORF type:complete len:478 (+),score=129.15 TRINITY_DN630_c0_g1_i4:58-1491(+)